MSWLPTFKIGLWNAWILMLYFPLHPLIMIVVDKAVGTGDIFKKMGDVPYEKGEKRDYAIFMVVTLILIVYSIFLPLKLGTAWFYAGLTVYLVGLAIFLTAIVNVATTPMGQFLIKGLYHFSRHPMYIAGSIINVGVGVASASWIFLLLSVVIIVLYTTQVVAEERGCLETYGDKYEDYMNRTPRWIRIAKSR
jgi:protein-S-isoprenylcysteine O-methyltransferase Ste14